MNREKQAEPKTRKPASYGKEAKIGLIDSRALMRNTFKDFFAKNIDDFHIVTFSNSEEIIGCIKDKHEPIQLIIFSVGSERTTKEAVRSDLKKVESELPDIPKVVLSDFEDANCVGAAFRYHCRGYLTTSMTPTVTTAALKLVIAGGTFVPPFALSSFSESQNVGELPYGDPPRASTTESFVNGFTTRQMDVLRLMYEGNSNKVIAYDLDIQESTVKVHVREIMKKLKATNRTHACFLASSFFENEY